MEKCTHHSAFVFVNPFACLCWCNSRHFAASSAAPSCPAGDRWGSSLRPWPALDSHCLVLRVFMEGWRWKIKKQKKHLHWKMLNALCFSAKKRMQILLDRSGRWWYQAKHRMHVGFFSRVKHPAGNELRSRILGDLTVLHQSYQHRPQMARKANKESLDQYSL